MRRGVIHGHGGFWAGARNESRAERPARDAFVLSHPLTLSFKEHPGRFNFSRPPFQVFEFEKLVSVFDDEPRGPRVISPLQVDSPTLAPTCRMSVRGRPAGRLCLDPHLRSRVF